MCMSNRSSFQVLDVTLAIVVGQYDQLVLCIMSFPFQASGHTAYKSAVTINCFLPPQKSRGAWVVTLFMNVVCKSYYKISGYRVYPLRNLFLMLENVTKNYHRHGIL
jgi:hypothetical protein